MKTILILSANSKGTTSLRLDEEVREINAGLERSQHRDRFVLEQKWAVRPRDISRAMLDLNPQIVHFSGHGTGDEGLVFEDETGSAKLVDGEALAGLFDLFAKQVECVVLNGCYSEVQASVIAEHINYVIGMKKAIGDRAAIEFAVGFYDALGAGKTVEFAYKFGCVAIRLAGIPEQLTPVLKNNLKRRELIIKHKPLEDSLFSCDTSIVSRNQVLSQNQIQAIETYRQFVEEFVLKDGVLSELQSNSLKEKRKKLSLPEEEAFRIEEEVLQPKVYYHQKMQEYQQIYVEQIYHKYPISEQIRNDLKRFQEVCNLQNEDLEKFYNCLANTWYSLGNIELAIYTYKEAVHINPNNAITHKNLGNVWLTQGNIEKAISEYREAISIEPCDADTHALLGNIYYTKDLLDEAIYEYKEVLKTNHNDAIIHNRLGLALYSKGMIDEAIAEYEEAILINPSIAQSYNGLGIALYEKGDMNKAVYNFQKAIDIEPKNGKFHRYLAIIIYKYSKNSLGEAISKFKQAIRLNPSDALAYTYLACVLAEQGKQEDAVVSLEDARNLFREQGMTQEAEQIYQAFQQKLQGNRNWMNAVKQLISFWKLFS